MGRGKIEIKLENQTNRQVSLIMQSSTDKIHEYISPTTTTKKMLDLYQKNLQIDLWSSHYEAMKENLWKLKEVNNKLRRDIRQRLGHDLNGLTIYELRDLEEKMARSLIIIRERKYHVIKTQTDYQEKGEELGGKKHSLGNLIMQEAALEDPQYGYVDNEGDFESAVALANGASNFHNNHSPNNNHNLDNGNGGGSLMSSITHLHDLRLA
ncbi:hypothetical protein M0R45_004065 [Rubus argutus]|uniref:K-box domain-containing protein n=1 Tax=Rubus argutus TaxID=59490 RepID=A0AAW1YHS3_RUBAR